MDTLKTQLRENIEKKFVFISKSLLIDIRFCDIFSHKQNVGRTNVKEEYEVPS